MLVKNKNTGAVWAVPDAHAAFLIGTGDFEKAEPEPTKPKRTRAKATPKDEPTESGE